MFSIDFLINFAINHQILIYLILFLGSFFETIIGISFFVFGEIFFLAGAILAGMNLLNIWLVCFILYLGGILGDFSSYLIGKKYGKKFYNKISKYKFFSKKINIQNLKKGEIFFKKHGGKSIFIGRFLGPVSWITPFLSGIFKLNIKTFFIYDIPAVILGIGQFIILGYFFGSNYLSISSYIEQYFFIVLFFVIIIYFLYKTFKKKVSKIQNKTKSKIIKLISKNLIKYILLILIIYFLILFFMFFIYQNPNNSDGNTPIIYENYSMFLKNNDFNLYYDNEFKKSPIQLINVIFITNNNITNLFKNSNWIKNLNFKNGKISMKKFYSLFQNNTMPISNLYFNNISQDLSFQKKSNSSLNRVHIRIYNKGVYNNAKVYFGSISSDNGLTLDMYKNFLIPMHNINPNIDLSRDNLLVDFKNYNFSFEYLNSKFKINKSYFKEEDLNYYSDGKILIIKFEN